MQLGRDLMGQQRPRPAVLDRLGRVPALLDNIGQPVKKDQVVDPGDLFNELLEDGSSSGHANANARM